ncbi:MAG: hypothetical protein RBU37_09800 [Myxococcota bacterium]|nr:hypothetical protein [Myxococcota bacterium]
MEFVRCGSPRWLGLMLSMLLWACSGATVPSGGPVLMPVEPVPSEDTVEPSEAVAPQFVERFDGRVRAESVQLVSRDGVAAAAFDDEAGDAYLLTREGLHKLASRAHVGCLAMDAEGGILLGLLLRSSTQPTSALEVHHVDESGNALQAPWTPQAPELWVDPGARCVLLPTEDGFGVLLRAREATADAVLDLWWTHSAGQSRAYGQGPSLPTVYDAAPCGASALLVLTRIRADERGVKRQTHVFYELDAAGALHELALTVPEDASLGLASEPRSAALLWLRPPLSSPGQGMEVAQASVQTTFLNPASLRTATDEVRLRTEVYRYVSRESGPRAFFLEGRWHMILAPEPFSLHLGTEDAPYHELLFSLEEGRSTPELLPEGLHALRVVDDVQGGFALALGAADPERPGFHLGLSSLEGGFSKMELELAPRQPEEATPVS